MKILAASPDSQHRAFSHFSQRLGERFGAGIDAQALWCALVRAFADNDWKRLQYVTRVSRYGRRIFAFVLADGRSCFVLFDCKAGMPVTVFSAGMMITREGREPIRLEALA